MKIKKKKKKKKKGSFTWSQKMVKLSSQTKGNSMNGCGF